MYVSQKIRYVERNENPLVLYALTCNRNQLQIIPNHRKITVRKQSTIMGSKWIEATVVASSTRSSFVINMARRSFISDDDPTVYSDLVSIGIP